MLLFAVMGACTQEPESSPEALTGRMTVEVPLSIADVTSVEAVIVPPVSEVPQWTISEPLAIDSGAARGVIVEVPAGLDRTVTVNAFAGASLICTGSATTDVVADQMVTVHLVLQCDSGGGDTGGVIVNGELNFRPRISAVVIAPSMVVPAGGEISVRVSATDPDGDALTYLWESTCGSFADTAAYQTIWTAPPLAGTCTLTVTVSDNRAGSNSSQFGIDVDPPSGTMDTGFGTTGIVHGPIVQGVSEALSIRSDGTIAVVGQEWAGGALDFGFTLYDPNGNGTASFPVDFGTGEARGKRMAIQDDGKIVVVGDLLPFSGSQMVLARFKTDGSLDPEFNFTGITGVAFTGFGSSANDLAIQSDGKIVVAGSSNSGTGDDIALARFNTDGSLDTSFGIAGRVITDIGIVDDQAFGIALQSDGKIVVTGQTMGPDLDLVLLRYSADGSLDGGFGSGGITVTDFGGHDAGNSVAIQDDGMIVVAGMTAGSDFAIARFQSNGTLDNSFGTGGLSAVTFGPSTLDSLNRVLVQADGNIIAAGYSDDGAVQTFAVVRVDSDGNLDAGFGTNGLVATPVGADGYSGIVDISIQINNKIVAAGYAYDGLEQKFALARYNTNGVLDSGFDGDGVKLAAAGNGGFAVGVGIQTDGRIVASGRAYFNGSPESEFAVARFDSNGALDTGFSSDGFATAFGPSGDGALAVAVQPDGKFVAAGFAEADYGRNAFALVRYFADGSLDYTFGSGGRVLTDFGGMGGMASAVAIQADGKIIAGGNNRLARYLSGGRLDPAFGSGGILTSTITILAAAIQSDGKIVVAGEQGGEFAVARYHGNGTPDSAFGTAGVAATDMGPAAFPETANAVVIQADGKIVAGGVYSTRFALVRYLPNGTLDNSFGSGGKIAADTYGDGGIRGMGIQSDGKIVAAGGDIPFPDTTLARYWPDGSLDAGFGTAGILAVDVSAGGIDSATGLVLQPDGKIVFSAYATDGFTVVRLLP